MFSYLQRWIERYYETGYIKRKDYSKRDSIITKEILNFIKTSIDKNPTITLVKLKKSLKKTYKLKISRTYLFYIIENKLNYSSKQVRKKYYPENKMKTLKQEKIEFYETINKIGIKNIICIDESAFYLNMTKQYGKSKKGKRVYKTTNIYPFKKYNFICAIEYGKIVGFRLYKDLKGGIKSAEFNEFINDFIKDKYVNKTILMDNARFHKSKEIRNNILSIKNNILYSIAYNPATNPIENLFSQIKNYVRNDAPQTYELLKKSIKRTIKKYVKTEHLKNYYKYMFIQGDEFIKKHKK